MVEYDPGWPGVFEWLRDRLDAALADVTHVTEHVGSTAVRGLAAKPIIDVDVVVSDETAVGLAVKALAAAGWRHEGDLGIKGREAFLPPADAPYHHLYVVMAGSGSHRDHIDLRDFLRMHPGHAADYATLKRELAVLLTTDREAYVRGKHEMITEFLRMARSEGGSGRSDQLNGDNSYREVSGDPADVLRVTRHHGDVGVGRRLHGCADVRISDRHLGLLPDRGSLVGADSIQWDVDNPQAIEESPPGRAAVPAGFNADGGGSQDGNWNSAPFTTFDQLDVTKNPLVLRMVRTCESLNRFVVQHDDPGHAGNALASAQSSTSSGSGSACVAAISAAARRMRSGSAASGFPSISAAAIAISARSGRASGYCA